MNAYIKDQQHTDADNCKTFMSKDMIIGGIATRPVWSSMAYSNIKKIIISIIVFKDNKLQSKKSYYHILLGQIKRSLTIILYVTIITINCENTTHLIFFRKILETCIKNTVSVFERKRKEKL